MTALDVGSPAATIAEAVFARALSALKDERVTASVVLPGPDVPATAPDRDAFIEQVRQALYASKIAAYAQGFQLLNFSAQDAGWHLDFASIARMWRGGCIIRAAFLDRVAEAFGEQHDLPNLLLAPYFRDAIATSQAAWRQVISRAVLSGIPTPAFSSALPGRGVPTQRVRSARHGRQRVRVDERSLHDAVRSSASEGLLHAPQSPG